jgi:toxin ParE1/3/4
VPVIVNKSPAAYCDLESIVAYIQQDNPDAAHRFLKAAEKIFELLASQPLLGEAYPHSKHPELRFWTMGRRFRNYVVFYQPIVNGVEIVRVMYGAQNLSIPDDAS